MNACNVTQPGGNNQDCLVPLSEVKNMWLCDKDTIFTWSEKGILSNWTDKIKDSTVGLQIYVGAGLDSYDVTTDDPNIVTQPVNKGKVITNNPVPSFVAYLDSNACDYKELETTLKGGTYGIFYELHNGDILGYIDQSGTNIGSFRPLKAKVSAISKQFQEIDSTQAFRVYVNHTNVKEFNSKYYLETVWDTAELSEAMPVGLNMLKTAAYAAGDQTVEIKIRCANAKTGLVVGDFETDAERGNVSTPAVTTLVEDGGGNYTLTVQKDAIPVNMVDGDVASMRVKVVSGTDITHVSGWVQVEGVTP